ncbi:putative D,D-dipeptide-binding periplasmic protein DdpA precursor [Sporomusa ovata DSM 2662]|uniref:Dipeptide-binding ABC transporter, periplasmic substrate-binding component (TC 3.A.1.5.2) Putative hemin-binding lipoprotein n=1 Tax=Sporomusa ovata TaxID=2378 RepID=A0A0U1KYQ7_9FIRM|nr:ABC transporter substrate-binding protein [Sporomusa ovata]EQB29560.1 D,D-dipeptide-binding periplasmic protein DdpA [Sporomusa ovata DSM 2662]CQR72073.1 Dipeptide-binding ABC transporter, periplasmic substrate-binding component (TC 3.A.1.5.2); Putative hemin-binding lipoprotein [Sporomusa ovata]
MKKILMLVMLCFLLAGCGGKPAEQAKVPKDTLVIGMASDLATIDPAATMDNASWKITYPCYDRLVKYKTVDGKSSTEVEPMAAESWTVSPDGKEWVFKLRQDIKFHDGTPVNAQAVKFSFDRVLKIRKGPADYFPTLKTVEVVDDYTVKFIMEKPFPPFLYTLATNAASIINPAVMKYEKDGDLASGYLASHTMGSGAYDLKEWNSQQNIKLQAMEGYWGGNPALKTILIQFIKDASTQRLQLENGDLDIAESIPADQLDALKGKSDLQISEFHSLNANLVYINNKKVPLNNVKVRQALNYAIDYQTLIQGAIKGKGIQLKGPVPEGLWGYDANLKSYSTNVEKAKQLLAEAGVGSNLTLKLLYSDYKAYWESEALLIQDNLSKVGIKVELEKVAWATLREKVDKADFDLCLGVWSPDYADPQMFMTYLYDSRMQGLSGNRAFYKNDQIDILLREAERISEQPERVKLYQQAQQIALEDAPYILLFQSDIMTAMRKNVQGFVFNPMLENMYNFESMNKK